MKQKRDREEACFTCGHYHDFEGGEPCSVCGHVIADAALKGRESVMPTTLVPGFLYLGNYDTASRQELLKAMNITHILNTVPTCQALYKNTFTYHTVSESPPPLEECFSFLDSANQQDKRVLVYCMSGHSRSPTVVVAYLMKLRGWRLAEAYKWVKDKRPSINISAGDAKRLMEFELSLHGSTSVPLGLSALSLPGELGTPVTHDLRHAGSNPQHQLAPTAPGSQAQAASTSWPSAVNPGPVLGSPAAPFTFSPGGLPPSAPFVFGSSARTGEQASEMES